MAVLVNWRLNNFISAHLDECFGSLTVLVKRETVVRLPISVGRGLGLHLRSSMAVGGMDNFRRQLRCNCVDPFGFTAVDWQRAWNCTGQVWGGGTLWVLGRFRGVRRRGVRATTNGVYASGFQDC